MWLHWSRVTLVTIATVLVTMFGAAEARLAVMSIDLGSEFMKIAIVKPGVPMEIVLNEDSARKTASIVAMRNGERYFGNAAESTAVRFPKMAYWYLTHIVGRSFDDPHVQEYKSRFPYYNLVKDENRGTVQFEIDEETRYSPEELLAMQLEKARDYAEAFADQPVKDCVITVPAFYNQAERRAIVDAAEMAGLTLLQIMSDNAAVALNYGVFRRKMFTNVTQYYMYYDMGATSTTATIVGYQVVKTKEGTRVESNPQLVIKGVGFDRDLGGLEISLRLRNHLARKFNEQKKTKTDIFTNDRAMAKLLKEAQRVKKVLSANVEHHAQVEGLLDEVDFKTVVTREELETMCQDLFDRVTKPVEDALKISEITLPEITEVILMGGGTRVPKVQEILLKFLGRSELGKSINTDEAAAMGAVYQAAYLGKGFKVKTFHVKEANIYPIMVEFAKYRTQEDSVEPPKIIKRTLFNRMNPYPQRKVMTFNKHFKDFGFNVSYGDLSFLRKEEMKAFKTQLIESVNLTGVEEAFEKHNADNTESKGIKAHFRMDENGILVLERVESVFEKEEIEEKKEESTWSKLGDTISGLFGSSDKKEDEEVKTETEGDNTTQADGEGIASNQDKLDPTGTEQNQTGSEEEKTADKSEQPPAEEMGSEEEQKKEETKEEREEEEVEQKVAEEEQKTEETGDKKEEEKDQKKEETGEKKDTEEKKDEKGQEGEKKEEKVTKTVKQVTLKENITTDSLLVDITPLSKTQRKASKKKLSDLRAKDQEKKMLEKARNELESFIYDMKDKITQEEYEQCSTEAERETLAANLADASDWLDETDMDTKKEAYIKKLKDLKKEVKDLEFRVSELKERPQALEALKSMLNHSEHFLIGIKNLSQLEDPLFTEVEVTTLEKLINNTIEWRKNTLKEQKNTPGHEKPKLLVEDVAQKISELDREVKYLINKAKNFKPKPKPKATNKTKTSDKSENVTDNGESEKKDEKGDNAEKEGTTKSTVDSELPPPPTEETSTEDSESKDTKEEEPLELEGTPETTTQKPESNTHDAGDL